MEYKSYSYITPPRAEGKVAPATLPFYEQKGWIAQCKKNGTNSVIFVPPSEKIFAKTRHNDDHKAWKFTEGSSKIFDETRNAGWNVFNAELMHSKGNGFRDINYLHDVLVWNGEYLIGKTYQERFELLQNIFCDIKDETHSHYVINDHTWLAKNFKADFSKLFHSLTNNEDEGLVLKNPKGKLELRDNTGWLVKCRKFHKNYGF